MRKGLCRGRVRKAEGAGSRVWDVSWRSPGASGPSPAQPSPDPLKAFLRPERESEMPPRRACTQGSLERGRGESTSQGKQWQTGSAAASPASCSPQRAPDHEA